MSEKDLPKISELPRIIKNHPFGLFIAIIIFGLILIYRGVFGCLLKILIRLPFNLLTPENILADGICNPDKIFKVKLGEELLNLFQHQWFIWLILILGFALFLFFQIKKPISKKN